MMMCFLSSLLSLCVFSESSLISKNLSTVLDIMDDSDWLWYVFGLYVNIPESELDRISSQYFSDRERKQAVIDLFISKHPAPSWTLVAHTLYKIGGWYSVSCLKSLDLLQQLFPTAAVEAGQLGDDGGVSCLKSLDLLQQLFPTGTIYTLYILHSVYTILSVFVLAVNTVSK